MSGQDTGARWYHVIGNTYGTWLRGDPRGWRARHHREHVEGDCRNPPPPGTYDRLERRSRRLMKRSAVLLAPDERRLAGQGLVEKLLELDVQLLAASVTEMHYHLLGKFPGRDVRDRVGRAKKNAAHKLRPRRVGGLWAARCAVRPIRDRAHQRNVFQYILDHVDEGAWVWSFRDGTPWLDGEGDAR